jgi:hypothetical protein
VREAAARVFRVETKKASVAGTDLEQVEEIRRQIAALTDASMVRHRLARGTPEYAAALEKEENLADRVWRLGAALPPIHERRSDRPPRERAEPSTRRAR